MAMSYWIQKADFSTDEFDPVDVSAAVSVAESHDWTAEIDRLESLSAEGAEYCDPGIGFVPGDGRILHICPNRETFYVHYHYSREARFLGLFKTTRQVTRSAFDLPISRMGDFVRRFFDADHDWFAENTTSA